MVINSLMFVSLYSVFTLERMRSIGLAVTGKALPPSLIKIQSFEEVTRSYSLNATHEMYFLLESMH